MAGQERLIHWDGTPAGVCARKDNGADREQVDLGNGTTVLSLAEATWCANVTCPTCRAGELFTEWNARQDAYFAELEAENQEFFDWLETPEGQATWPQGN